jgi:SAM-dependent methyltransferase
VGRETERWRTLLAECAIPPPIAAAAPQTPYFFDPAVFDAAADDATARVVDTPSDRVARDALGHGGTVLDVGVGGGAASIRLGAGQIVGVDSSPVMLESFVRRASAAAIPTTPIEGRWPDVAGDTPNADVVVCHHVLYNVADLEPFVAALTAHARSRVVVELTAVHPLRWLAPYWQALHGVAPGPGPTADDALAALREVGIDAEREDWTRVVPMIGEGGDDEVERIGRRLCIGPDRHEELRAVLAATPPPSEREVVTLWW